MHLFYRSMSTLGKHSLLQEHKGKHGDCAVFNGARGRSQRLHVWQDHCCIFDVNFTRKLKLEISVMHPRASTAACRNFELLKTKRCNFSSLWHQPWKNMNPSKNAKASMEPEQFICGIVWIEALSFDCYRVGREIAARHRTRSTQEELTRSPN